MMNEYKSIAFNKMIDTIGRDYIRDHIKCMASATNSTENEVEVTFFIYEPSEASDNNLIVIDESPVNNFFSVAISKRTKECTRVNNKIRL